MIHIVALAAVVAVASATAGARAPDAHSRRPVPRLTMARIAGGTYRPLYGIAGRASVRVASFTLDREPVTRGEYLAFVRANPSWRRSAVRPAFAGGGYLSNWTGDLDAGDATDLRRPVTAVSWFGAKAYCEAQGKRLPTVDEWEYAAAASETRADATRDPRFVRRLLALYAQRPSGGVLLPVGSGFRNVHGVRDLHGGAWEWTLDFDGATTSHDAHDAAHRAGAPDHMPSCASAAIGATDQTNYPGFLRYAFRAALSSRSTALTLGFRCAGA
jgi:formylglycine-generating enzyme